VPRPAAQPEPANLQAIKNEVLRGWGTIDLLDALKEVEWLTGLTDEFSSIATRENLPREILRRRLLLVLFALGTNMGIRRIVATGEHGESEGALRRVRRTHVNRDNLRRAIVRVVNGTLAERDPRWWGTGTAGALEVRDLARLLLDGPHEPPRTSNRRPARPAGPAELSRAEPRLGLVLTRFFAPTLYRPTHGRERAGRLAPPAGSLSAARARMAEGEAREPRRPRVPAALPQLRPGDRLGPGRPPAGGARGRHRALPRAQRYPSEDDVPDLKIDDPTVVALLTAHFSDDSSPSLERLNELTEGKLAPWRQEGTSRPPVEPPRPRGRPVAGRWNGVSGSSRRRCR
jgi:Tn3 transposase DDE domain